jgi:hypothetical protein
MARAICTRGAVRPGFTKTLIVGTISAAALVSAAIPARAVTIPYAFQNVVNTNDVTFNQELGINSAGIIAGYFGSGAAGHPNQGYTVGPPYTSFTSENFPGSAQTQVTAINNAGVTVGFWSNTNMGVGMDSNFGFTDVGGSFTNVNNLQTPMTTPSFNQLLGVNNSNIAVGFYTDVNGVNHGYTYNISTMAFSLNINDPNANPNMGGTTATAINNQGKIAGFYTDLATGNTFGFIDNNGTFTTIDPANSTDVMLLGLNDNGYAVGTYVDAMGVMHGLLYDLNDNTFENIDDPFGIGTTTINGINDLNQLVGFYTVPADQGNTNTIGLLADPIPEPASLSLLATGLLGLGMLGRRRRSG